MTGVRRPLIAVAVLLTLATAARAAEPARGFQVRTFKGADGQEVKYALFVPHSYTPEKPVPVILFLHGTGEAGTDGQAQTRVGLGAAVRAREKTFPLLVIFPQAQKADWSNKLNLIQMWYPGHPEGDRALAILAEVQQQYQTDPKRLYLSGISMGGFGTWALAEKFPDRWAAIVPICGGGQPAWAPKIKNIPCWCFHGADDPVVPVLLSRVMIEALRKAGGQPKYTEYRGVGHNSWDKAYATDELYEWLLQQRLK
jgi:predicted peptidase